MHKHVPENASSGIRRARQMTFSPARQLTAILLLVVVLLTALNAIAHDLQPNAMMDTCVCQLQSGDCNGESEGELPENHPGNHTNDCCDHEDCCPDDIVPPCSSEIIHNDNHIQSFLPKAAQSLPEVYLPIFVPPEG